MAQVLKQLVYYHTIIAILQFTFAMPSFANRDAQQPKEGWSIPDRYYCIVEIKSTFDATTTINRWRVWFNQGCYRIEPLSKQSPEPIEIYDNNPQFIKWHYHKPQRLAIAAWDGIVTPHRRQAGRLIDWRVKPEPKIVPWHGTKRVLYPPGDMIGYEEIDGKLCQVFTVSRTKKTRINIGVRPFARTVVCKEVRKSWFYSWTYGGKHFLIAYKSESRLFSPTGVLLKLTMREERVKDLDMQAVPPPNLFTLPRGTKVILPANLEMNLPEGLVIRRNPSMSIPQFRWGVDHVK